jgi:hypothetical protein
MENIIEVIFLEGCFIIQRKEKTSFEFNKEKKNIFSFFEELFKYNKKEIKNIQDVKFYPKIFYDKGKEFAVYFILRISVKVESVTSYSYKFDIKNSLIKHFKKIQGTTIEFFKQDNEIIIKNFSLLYLTNMNDVEEEGFEIKTLDDFKQVYEPTRFNQLVFQKTIDEFITSGSYIEVNIKSVFIKIYEKEKYKFVRINNYNFFDWIFLHFLFQEFENVESLIKLFESDINKNFQILNKEIIFNKEKTSFEIQNLFINFIEKISKNKHINSLFVFNNLFFKNKKLFKCVLI